MRLVWMVISMMTFTMLTGCGEDKKMSSEFNGNWLDVRNDYYTIKETNHEVTITNKSKGYKLALKPIKQEENITHVLVKDFYSPNENESEEIIGVKGFLTVNKNHTIVFRIPDQDSLHLELTRTDQKYDQYTAKLADAQTTYNDYLKFVNTNLSSIEWRVQDKGAFVTFSIIKGGQISIQNLYGHQANLSVAVKNFTPESLTGDVTSITESHSDLLHKEIIIKIINSKTINIMINGTTVLLTKTP